MIIQHSAETPEHYTPSPIIHAAWKVMGGIDLDPATTAKVNRELVGAQSFFTKETNGLDKPWHGKVWLNPPGGVTETRKSNAATWWDKLVKEYRSGRIEQALFMGFTLEIQRTTQQSNSWICDFPFCIPDERLDFLREQEDGTFRRGGQPAHANIIAYLPPLDSRNWSHWEDPWSRAFKREFSAFGRVRC